MLTALAQAVAQDAPSQFPLATALVNWLLMQAPALVFMGVACGLLTRELFRQKDQIISNERRIAVLEERLRNAGLPTNGKH